MALVVIGAARGASKGAMAGAALSIVTGAAVVAAGTGGLPLVGGIMIVKTGTVSAWAAVGSVAGAICGGTMACLKQRRGKREMVALLAELELSTARA